ncbi:MAG: tRNA guanosine(34) transglycosylase Tgt [Saprospiraceae bacterium]|nr:tRNA guanosine(34) transglycosylase Tgt [Saprospiraceae bacterium]
MMGIRFLCTHRDPGSSARCGALYTDHGEISTPVFMPVGTQATVKAVHQRELQEQIEAKIILGNTYHLYLRPGTSVIAEAGGLHQFMGWKRALLTDSGGYQVFSLSERRKLREEGVSFASHIDGSKHLFTPERVVDIQRMLGSDIMMALDECTPWPCERSYAEKSMGITHRWLERGMEQYQRTRPHYGHAQSFIPIAQGSVFDDLREQSFAFISQLDAPVYAIGGLSVGEPEEDLIRLVHLAGKTLPQDRARYLMGVGTPKNLLDAIDAGIDMFDCVLPTRNARHGILYTTRGILHIRNAKWKTDFTPVDEGLTLPTSRDHTRAYLRHLFHAGELLALQIASLQNLAFYAWLLAEARQQIQKGRFAEWKREILPVINRTL